MNEFEKVTKLVEIAHVSYEDAKKALDEANGDILDAMINLEKQGKVNNAPKQAQYTTGASAASPYRDVPAVVEQSKDTKGKSFFRDLGDGIKRIARYTVDNYVKVERKGDTIIKLPLWISIILLLAAWHLILIVMIISLFFDCKYSLEGKDDTSTVNNIMNEASEFAGKVKENFNTPAAENADSPYRNTAAESDSTVYTGTVDETDNTNE